MIKRTKYIAIIIFFALAGMKMQAQTDNAAGKIHWYSFEDAAKLNAQTHKKVFIDIFTDWCGWCKELDRSTFTNPAIVKLMNDNFIAVKLNAERKDTVVFNGYTFINPNPTGYRSTHQLASSMLKGKMMYPSMVFMDDSMRIITTVQSYLKPVDLEPILAYISQNKYNKVNFDTFKMAYKYITIDTSSAKKQNSTSVTSNQNIVKIPLRKDGNRYKIKVLLNDNEKLPFDFILDTGADKVLVTSDIFSTFYRAGIITKSDIKNSNQYGVADGTAVTGLNFNLNKIQIGSIIMNNIDAVVIDGSNECLLGGSLLNKFGKYTIDTINNQLIITK
jgi:clan AA aspartic protease (TIGR02281 family)